MTVTQRGIGGRLGNLLRREDFRRHPLRVVYRRVDWRLRWRLAPGRPFIVPFWNGLRIKLARSSASSGVYFNNGFSDESVARLFVEFLKPGMIALDCGAHIGEYTLLFAALVGSEGRVHAFEPDPRNFVYLRDNIALNGVRNACLNEVALADSEGTAQFVLGADPAASSIREFGDVPDGWGEAIVSVTTLDRYVAEQGLARVDAMKIDVEGAGAAVLRGGRRLLRDLRPGLIFMECEGRSGDPASVRGLLEELDYQVIARKDAYHLHAHLVARR